MSVALMGAVEQLALLRAGKISAVELAEEHIGRVERLNPVLNAIVDWEAERVRGQARAVDARWGRGGSAGSGSARAGLRPGARPGAGSGAGPGLLEGLPVTVKGCIEVAGHRCEVGSVLRRGQVAAEDAEAVQLLRAAGAVILGVTNCPEFLMAYETDSVLYGRTRNPWDLERTAGGSSGGEAAAIAAGLSAGGLGSDSGGSVREPAHFSGICALKPTSGRISARGHVPPNVGPFSTLGAIGPMARRMEDVGLLFRVASGRAGSPGAEFAGQVSLEEARGVRIGWFDQDDDEGDAAGPVTAETRAAVRAAAGALGERGFRVEEVRPPRSLGAARRLWDVLFVQCGAMVYEPVIAGRRGELSPVFAQFLEMAAARGPLGASALLDAWCELDVVRERLVEEMGGLLLTPVCAVPAFRHGERAWMVEGRRVEYLEAMRYMQWFNVLGAPAAVVPVGQSGEGLPIGVQVAGVPNADELVLTVAGVVDGAFGYRAPPLAAG